MGLICRLSIRSSQMNRGGMMQISNVVQLAQHFSNVVQVFDFDADILKGVSWLMYMLCYTLI